MQILITLLSFLLPTQFSYTLDFLNINLIGFKIDYLIPTIYLTDILAFLIIGTFLKSFKFSTKHLIYIITFVLFAIINIYNSEFVISSLYKWIKLTELIILGLVIKNFKKFDLFKNFILPLSVSMIVVNFLGILQFINKGSIGGVFYYLGERSFNFIDSNVSPYPYSTFSHPNSFAGFLLVFVIFLIKNRERFNSRYFYFSLTLSIVNLFLTNSLNVYLAIVIILLIKFSSLKSAPLFFIDLNARYITHRIELIKSAFLIIKENFLTGIGLNNFIPSLIKYNNSYINSWELQPVHNIFLLVFSELGIFGFIIFILVILNILNITNLPLLAILITGMSDHYSLTLQQNMLLFTYVIALSTIKK